jgi:hypothetical protein
MANGLSFMFNARAGGAEHLLKGLSQALPQAAAAVAGPDILHYAWLVEVPGLTGKDGQKTYLLTTVYDELFGPYIEKLVNADFRNNDGLFFDSAARAIDGMQAMVPVHKHLSEFIKFIGDRDLTQSHPAGGFKEFYPWTVARIHQKLGGNPSSEQP